MNQGLWTRSLVNWKWITLNMTPAGQYLVTNPLQLSTKAGDWLSLFTPGSAGRWKMNASESQTTHPSPVIFWMGSGQSHRGAQVKYALPLAMQHLPPNRKKRLWPPALWINREEKVLGQKSLKNSKNFYWNSAINWWERLLKESNFLYGNK